MLRRTFKGVAALTSLLVVAPRASLAQSPAIGVFPIAVFVAEQDGAKVASPEWVDAQIARAGILYGALGIRFQRVSFTPIDSGHAQLLTRKDRDALAKLRRPEVINVFVVASLKDVDEKDTWRRGVHWRPAAAPAKRFIILSVAASPTVLAHELGHYFGNPHTTAVDNIMSYARTDKGVYLDPTQITRTKATARSILRSGEVKAITP